MVWNIALALIVKLRSQRLVVAVEDGAGVHPAGAVEEHVDRAEAVGQGATAGAVGHVERPRLAAGDVGAGAGAQVRGDDPRAFPRERLGARASDALRRARDQRRLAGQPSHVVCLLTSMKPAPSGSSSSQNQVCSPISQAVPVTSTIGRRRAVDVAPLRDPRLQHAAGRPLDAHRAIALDEADGVEHGRDRRRALAGRGAIEPARLADGHDPEVGLAVCRPGHEQLLERAGEAGVHEAPRDHRAQLAEAPPLERHEREPDRFGVDQRTEPAAAAHDVRRRLLRCRARPGCRRP